MLFSEYRASENLFLKSNISKKKCFNVNFIISKSWNKINNSLRPATNLLATLFSTSLTTYSILSFTNSFPICRFPFILLYNSLKTPKVFNKFPNVVFVSIFCLFNQLLVLTIDILLV